MDRRAFLATGSLAAAASAAPASASVQRSGQAVRLKLGCQSGPTSDAHFAYFARYGVRNICAKPLIADGRPYATIEELLDLKAMGERHGISVDMVEPAMLQSHHIDRASHPSIMLGESPQRDRDIEAFQMMIRNVAAAGIGCIKYNLTLLGVLRTGTVPGRGDARNLRWDLAGARPDPAITRAGRIDADRAWERIGYFLDRVVPVAEEYKVRIACHPEDPGVSPEGYQGIVRVLGTIEGLQRFVMTRPSPYHGLNLCLGTVAENLDDPARQIDAVIRWFGTRNKIFNIHFRNIRGRRDAFEEVFPDEGDVDMVRAFRTLLDVGYSGMVMPDHVPEVPGDRAATLASFAFCYGYIRALIQAAATGSGQRRAIS